MKDILYLKCEAQKGELAQFFKEEREAWWESDAEGWAQLHTIHPGIRCSSFGAGMFA